MDPKARFNLGPSFVYRPPSGFKPWASRRDWTKIGAYRPDLEEK